ncbi:MAG: tetratricopeptide repeat protein [Bacteroidota bacterium]
MRIIIKNLYAYILFCIFVSVILIFVSPDLIAQQSKSDSLLTDLKSASDDTSKVNLLNELFKEFQSVDKVKALAYATQALELSMKLNFQRGVASSYNNIGLANFNEGKSNEALENYLKALEIFTEISYKKGSSIVLANIGNLFYDQGNYPKTIEYFLQSLTLARECGDQQRSASLLGKIGIVYYDQGYYAKALSYYFKSLEIREEIGDKQGIAYVYGSIGHIYAAQENYDKSLEYYEKSLKIDQETNDTTGIANIYSNIGDVYNAKKDFSKALEYFQKAIALATEIGYKQVIAASLNNIGDIYKEQEKYVLASEYYSKALKINQELDDKQKIANSYYSIAEIYRKTGNNDNALLFFNKSLETAAVMDLKDLMKDNYQKIAETYASMENYMQAYNYHKLYSDIRDSIYNDENMQQITDMQAKYETAEIEKENTLLKKDAEVQNLKYDQNVLLMYSLIAVFVLLVILTLFIFNNYRHRQRLKQLHAEIALRESEEKYRDLANLLPQTMFEVDQLNMITFINTAGMAISGYTHNDIVEGMGIAQIFAHDEKEKILNYIDETHQGVAIKSQEYNARRKDGSMFPVLCYFSPFLDIHKNQCLRGIAIDITELKQVERKILSKIIETEEKERKRVAKDLHDGLGPLLSSIKLYVNELQSPDSDDKEKPEMLKYTNELIDDAVSSTRTIANNLMPGIITDYGLVKALQSFCNKLNISKSINIKLEADDENRRYDKTIEITLYRVLMELINNTIKHASAKDIVIIFGLEKSILHVNYKDDGVGFNIAQTLKDPKIGLGLNNIINRVKSIQGLCEMKSAKGSGTEVKIEIDLNKF